MRTKPTTTWTQQVSWIITNYTNRTKPTTSYNRDRYESMLKDLDNNFVFDINWYNIITTWLKDNKIDTNWI